MAKKKFVHECQLTDELKSSSTKFENKILTRIWIYFFLISKKDFAKNVLRISKYGVKLEMKRHLKYYPNVIHPFSLFRYLWEIFMIMILIIQMIILPQMCYINKHGFYFLRHIYFALDNVCFLDVLLNFCTGLFDGVKCEIILEKKYFIRDYCFTYLVPDVLGSMPFDYILCILNMHNKISLFLRIIIVVCKYMHIFRLKLYLNRLRQKRQWPLYIYKICHTVIYYNLLFCLCISLLGTIRHNNPELSTNMVVDQLSYISLLGTTTNMIFGLEASTFVFFWPEICVHIIGRLCGTLLLIKFLAYVASYFANRNQTKPQFIYQQKEMQRYLYTERIPSDIIETVNKYNMYHYEGKYYNEKYIWRNISDELRTRAIYDILEPIFKTDIFTVCPLDMLYMVAAKVHKRRYLANMEIYRAGTHNTLLTIIRTGSIKLITENNENVAVLYEGKVFHDVLPVTDENVDRRIYTVIANEFCIAYKILYNRLENIAKNFPGIQERIDEILAKKTRVILNNPVQLDLDAYYSTDN